MQRATKLDGNVQASHPSRIIYPQSELISSQLLLGELSKKFVLEWQFNIGALLPWTIYWRPFLSLWQKANFLHWRLPEEHHPLSKWFFLLHELWTFQTLLTSEISHIAKTHIYNLLTHHKGGADLRVMSEVKKSTLRKAHFDCFCSLVNLKGSLH